MLIGQKNRNIIANLLILASTTSTSAASEKATKRMTSSLSSGSCSSSSRIFLRKSLLSGSNGNENEVIFAGHNQSPGTEQVMVFFGGDVQDFEDRMLQHRDNHKYSDWSLERTAGLMTGNGPRERRVLVVRPSKIELGTFSRYTNFVDCNKFGSPNHTEDTAALEHLRQIMVSLAKRFPEEGLTENTSKILVGFSKGCVVLNQLLHSFHSLDKEGTSSSDDDLSSFAKSIRKMIWLDGGHSGGKGTWVTNSKILEKFCSMGIEAEVRVTPYQIKDERRPWIGQEEKRFSGILGRSLGGSFSRSVHFGDEDGSLERHFQILETVRDKQL